MLGKSLTHQFDYILTDLLGVLIFINPIIEIVVCLQYPF